MGYEVDLKLCLDYQGDEKWHGTMLRTAYH